MNELIVAGTEIKVDSRQIAECAGKRHDNILVDIRKEVEELGEVGLLIFKESYYINSQNKVQPCYIMNEDGAMQLALKYDAMTRFKVIQKLKELKDQMKQEATPQSINSKMLFQIAQSLEEKEKQILLLSPKAESFDCFISGENLQDMTTTAKVLKWGRNTLFSELRKRKVLRGNNTPYQEYIDRGYFEVKEKPIEMSGQIINKPQTYCTPKGIDWLHKFLNREAIQCTNS